MQPLCAYSGKPVCNGCKGAVYECDPRKNTDCTKENCGICLHTHNPQFSTSPDMPQCKMILKKQQEKAMEIIRNPIARLYKKMEQIQKEVPKIDQNNYKPYPHEYPAKEHSGSGLRVLTVVVASFIASVVANLLLR